MCEKCDDIQKKIDQYRRVLADQFDRLTQDRTKAGLAELEKRLAEMHQS